ncbi:MAG TPA: YggS family pyridoxal phosphate-dependent enzyme [Candidatus Limadaptatus stercorigallinarum]|uniref:Pyridoxal phosphate homeostasis protein n=1 Tax=Candidatus Limadaptatus stercorigallinarum TaxID=2840845 RepID=A0A9D1HUP6_9FIRM|nr:YggS family pyridoxal phosphate-dependent enzyme [Christensenellales bacterium]HIU21585.1 YggS family pyridoxal phosphate-dependent enzyme [Candidatus Limadaptatus stercorigallinarum]
MVYTEHIEEVRRAVAECGREVTLVAAVKMQTKETVDELMRVAPDFVLGENRVQELTAKYDPAYRWHFIGQLQTNKVKYIADKVELIHSLDREELAKEIEKQAAKHGKVQDCLVEVNMGSEISKGGVAPAETVDFIRSLASYGHIRVRGLMSVLPNLGDTPELRALYASLRDLFAEVRNMKQENLSADYLSAGMSGDYKIALEYGSNMIRLGRTLFGERVYPASAI